jgi:hypothetical protein
MSAFEGKADIANRMSANDPKRTSDGAVVFSVLKVWRDRERACQ